MSVVQIEDLCLNCKSCHWGSENGSVCMQHFEGYDPEGFSMWMCDYKYNDENTINYVVMNKVHQQQGCMRLLVFNVAATCACVCTYCDLHEYPAQHACYMLMQSPALHAICVNLTQHHADKCCCLLVLQKPFCVSQTILTGHVSESVD